MRPRSGLLAPHGILWRGLASPPLPDPRFAGPLGLRSGEPPCCAPWHRSPGYDLRRAPYDHPDFTSNVLSEDLFRASLKGFPNGRCGKNKQNEYFRRRMHDDIQDNEKHPPR
jgi:hypothetical protein